MPSKEEILKRKDLQIKFGIGFVIFTLYAAFVIGQFVFFDHAKKSSIWVTKYVDANIEDQTNFDLRFPPFVVCPSYNGDEFAPITSLQCNFVLGSGTPSPLTSITPQNISIFTPRRGTTISTCYIVLTNSSLISELWRMDYITCYAETTGVDALLFIPGSSDFIIPNYNTMYYVLKAEVDTNIVMVRSKQFDSSGNLEQSTFNINFQELRDMTFSSGINFAFQYNYLGSIQQIEVHPYSFWIMLGVIGGGFVIFYAIYYAVVYAVLRLCNIRVPDDYETINEK